MSEFTNTHGNAMGFRWPLLATASAIALLGSAYGAGEALAADSDRPPLWIELGGQLEGLSNAQEPFSPPFVPSLAQEGILSPLRVQGSPHFGLGIDGSISFEPDGSNWIFSASVRYGRSNGTKNQHQQTPNAKILYHISLPNYGVDKYGSKYPSSHVKFADASAKQSERHIVLDFQAGKDVGLGLFGNGGSSVLSAGVRIAQFNSKSNVIMHLEPDLQYPTAPITSIAGFIAFRTEPVHFHDYAAIAANTRNFRGVGPSMAWNASVPFAGSSDSGEMTIDWGLNAAVLFGRQRASGQHRTSVQSFYRKGFQKGFNTGGGHFYDISTSTHSAALPHNRMRSVTVPNVGGFVGFSMRYSDVKLSLGYRADFFFGAIDGGIDTRKSENRGFYGPFASISVGLGD